MTPPTPLQAAREALAPFAARAEYKNFDQADDGSPCTFFCRDVREAVKALALIDAELAKAATGPSAQPSVSDSLIGWAIDVTKKHQDSPTGPSPTAEIDIAEALAKNDRLSAELRNATSAYEFVRDEARVRLTTARTEALEEAAKCAETEILPGIGQYVEGNNQGCKAIAAAIRALASGGGEKRGAT